VIINTKSKFEQKSLVQEYYKKIRTNIDFLSIDTKYQTIHFTSTIPEEGKTVTCANLGLEFSLSKKRTLIVDLDLRSPKIHKYFGVPNEMGIVELIHSESNEYKRYIQRIDEYLSVLTAGKYFPFPTELLSSNKLKEMIKMIRNDYDCIIIDSPPASLFADAKIISQFSDGTIYIVGHKKAKTELIKNTLRDLIDYKVNIIGSILTQIPIKELSDDKKYYYYNYYRNNDK